MGKTTQRPTTRMAPYKKPAAPSARDYAPGKSNDEKRNVAEAKYYRGARLK